MSHLNHLVENRIIDSKGLGRIAVIDLINNAHNTSLNFGEHLVSATAGVLRGPEGIQMVINVVGRYTASPAYQHATFRVNVLEARESMEGFLNLYLSMSPKGRRRFRSMLPKQP